ncbi:MAG TPA: DUF3122 domain-containing protein [Leptolyngbyaceae cyanobacterium M65_K2018_010]|nr:DUF3122 domain-containing protein [Leptolyngbyaceae cyanobacterium M65_K2018_010]
MKTLWRSLRRIGLALLLGLLLMLLGAAPAWASIHTYHEQPGQTTHRSTLSLRDQRDLAWQAILFKRYVNDDLQGIYLRLVGFPGQVVDRQPALSVQTGTATQWLAPYQVDGQTQVWPDNVAQYDFQSVLAQLPGPLPLTLVVPMAATTPAQLVVAPYGVAEWLQLSALASDAEADPS